MAFNAGSIEATLTLNRNPFTAGLKAARQQAQQWGRDPVELQIKPNIQATALARVKRQVEGIIGRATIRPQLDQTAVRALRERINAITGRANLRLGIAPGELQNLRQRINSVTGRVPVNLRLAEGTLTELRARLREARVLLPVHLRIDRTSFLMVRAQLATLGATVDVNLDLDENSGLAQLARRLAEIYNQTERASNGMRRFGNESSGAFRRADGAMRVFIALMPVLLPMIGALVQGAAGLGGALVAAFVGGAATLGAFAAVAIPTFQKVTEGAKLSREEIGRLPNGIREAAGALKTLQEQYQALVERTQANVGLALAEGFNAATAAVRTLDPLINSMATVIGNVGREATQYFSGAHWRNFVDFMSKEMVPVWMSFWDIVKYLTRAIMDLSIAFMPLAQWMFAAIADGMERFANWAGTLAGDPAFRQWIESVKESLRSFWQFLMSVVEFLWNLSNALAPVGVVVMDILSGIFTALSRMPPEWLAAIAGGVSAIMAALLFGASGPVAAVAGVIMGIAFAFAYLYDQNERVRSAVDGFVNDIETRLRPTIEFIEDAVKNKVIPAWEGLVRSVRENVLPALQELWDKFQRDVLPALEDLAKTIVDDLIPSFLEFWATVQPIVAWLVKNLGEDFLQTLEIVAREVDASLKIISGAFQTASGIIKGDWEQTGEGLKTITEGFWTGIAGIFGMNLDELRTKVQEWDRQIDSDWNTFWTEVGQGWTDFWTGVGQTFEDARTNISEGWNTFWTDVRTKYEEFKTTVLESWHGFWAGLLDGLGLNGDQIVNGWREKWDQMWIDASAKWEEIKAGWNAFWGFIGSILEAEKQKAITSWNTFWDGVWQKASDIWNTIRQAWNDFWTTGIGGKLNEEIGRFNASWNGFWDGVRTRATEIWNTIQGEWNNFWGQFRGTQDARQGESTQSWGEWFRGLGEQLGSFIRTELDNWNRFWGDLQANASRWWGDIQRGWEGMLNGIRDAAGRIWGSIESAFNSGVNSVRSAVNGLINPINNVLRTLGITPIPTLAAGGTITYDLIPGFASGGGLNFEHVGPGFKTNGPKAIVGEGNSKYPEYVIPTDPKYRSRATQLLTAAGKDMQLMQEGGVIGGLASAFGLPSLDSLLGAMTGMSYPFLDMAKAIGKKIYDGAMKKIQDALATLGGMLGGGGGGGGWQWQMAVLRQAFPGLPLISGFRPGAITATGNRSYHSMGRAVDVPPRMDVFNWIRANFGGATKELIFTPAGARQVWNGRPHVYTGVTAANHWDHVHWAFDQGGMLPPGASTVVNNTGKPEPVLTSKQWDAVMRANQVSFDPSSQEDNNRVVNTLEDIKELLERRGTGATINQYGVGGGAQENAQAIRLALRLS